MIPIGSCIWPWSLVGSAVWGGCGVTGRWNLAGGSSSLGVSSASWQPHPPPAHSPFFLPVVKDVISLQPTCHFFWQWTSSAPLPHCHGLSLWSKALVSSTVITVGHDAFTTATKISQCGTHGVVWIMLLALIFLSDTHTDFHSSCADLHSH